MGGYNGKVLMDMNRIWVFLDISVMDNKRFKVKRVQLGLRQLKLSQLSPIPTVLNSLVSPLLPFHSHVYLTRFSNPSKLLNINKVCDLTKLCIFFAIFIIIQKLLIKLAKFQFKVSRYLIIDSRFTLGNSYLSPPTSN